MGALAVKVSLVLLYISSLNGDLCASDDLQREAEQLVQLKKLEAKFYQISNSNPQSHKILLHGLMGYAAANTAMVWLDIQGAGPWFAISLTGGLGGVFSYLIPYESGRGFLWKVKGLRKLQLLLTNAKPQVFPDSYVEALNNVFEMILNDLLMNGHLATSFERWRFLRVAESFLDFYYSQENFFQDGYVVALESIYESIKMIEAKALSQKDLPIILRSVQLKQRYVGILSEFKQRAGHDQWKEWLERANLSSQQAKLSVSEEVSERLKALSKNNSRIKLLWRQRLPEAAFTLRLEVDPKGLLWLTASDHLKTKLQEKISSSESTNEFIGSLNSGVWLRFRDLEQKEWEFYEDHQDLPFSQSADMGRVEVTHNPFRLSGHGFLVHLEGPMKAKELRKKIPQTESLSVLRARLSRLYPDQLKIACGSFLKSL